MKVSVITVCFNSKEFIGQAIESVLSQTYENIEYIVIDGGSTDGTLDIIDKYRNEIAKIISEPDNGIYDAMNKGLKSATGKIIGILNSDDFYADDSAIETVVNTMTKRNIDICWGDDVIVNKKNTDKIVRFAKSSKYKEGKFRRGWHPKHTAFFVNKWIYEKHGLFNLNFPIAADYELMLRFLEVYKIKSCYIPKILVKMRAGGQSNKSLKNIIKANIECYNAWKINKLNISPLVFLIKPLSKIFQFPTLNKNFKI